MVSSKNIFYATNPACMLDALYKLIDREHVDLSNVLIFLPSRRAVRSAEKMFVEKNGGAVILPHLVALGEGVESDDFEDQEYDQNVVKNTERIAVLAKLLAQVPMIGNLSTALPIAHDFVRMSDYLENEGIDVKTIDWNSLVDDKYAAHFKNKVALFNVLTQELPKVFSNKQTQTVFRNKQIRDWCSKIDSEKYDLVIMCGSTASVPATADLMVHIAGKKNGRIILSGKIDGDIQDFELKTNPYNAEMQYLMRIGVNVSDVVPIDVGDSAIDFFNFAFGNNTRDLAPKCDMSHWHLVPCEREYEEANVVAEITSRALQEHKTVMIITPDAAGNQRIAAALNKKNIVADFSGGVPGTMVPAGRALLNVFDNMIENSGNECIKIYASKNNNLFDAISEFVMNNPDGFQPQFLLDDEASMSVWTAIKELSDALSKNDIVLSVPEIRVFIQDVLSSVSVRGKPIDDASVVVLGTIEARMQTADVVILTGLNDGMFPSRGYENAWLPIDVSEKIGLPSRDRKVSLMALDFMNLSCGKEVYWLRSCVSGGVETSESRFISRVVARGGQFDKDVLVQNILQTVRAEYMVDFAPLDYSAPNPPADWSDVFVTELELLIHNPYAFYAKHILRLRVKDDYWVGPDARAFGTLVHKVIEEAKDFTPSVLVARMDDAAAQLLGKTSVLYHFWHKRFVEIADLIETQSDLLKQGSPEITGGVVINVGAKGKRRICAKADRVWDGGVLDIKTGAAPTESQLLQGNMPQLPLEALILKEGGFKIKTTVKSKTPVMRFLQLKNKNVKSIEYDSEQTAIMINAAVDKVTALFNAYSAGSQPYEYHETSEEKYQSYDDLARVND